VTDIKPILRIFRVFWSKHSSGNVGTILDAYLLLAYCGVCGAREKDPDRSIAPPKQCSPRRSHSPAEITLHQSSANAR